ncbi:MAG: hypothetical protein EOM87_01350 [Clostridia bacterium]|nr:hypothetical protein [Clostridia bacterium]
MKLLEITKTYDQSAETTHEYFAFIVPSGIKELQIEFSFSPWKGGEDGLYEIKQTLKEQAPYYNFSEAEAKRYLPLRNLIEVSLDSPMELLGSAHRHGCNHNFFINKNQATYGFNPSVIYEGEWQLSLSFSAIVTSEVAVKLIVEGVYGI